LTLDGLYNFRARCRVEKIQDSEKSKIRREIPNQHVRGEGQTRETEDERVRVFVHDHVTDADAIPMNNSRRASDATRGPAIFVILSSGGNMVDAEDSPADFGESPSRGDGAARRLARL